MILKSNFLSFEINDSANEASFILNDKPEAAAKGSDFWRLILDDGLRTEIPVCSTKQSGSIKEQDGKLVIEYDKLVSEYGDTYDVYLHGHRIAQINRNECYVKLWSCGYQTNVTKSRLNCVLYGLYIQKGIWQKNGVWYIGTHCDCEEFVDGMKIYF